MGFDRAGALAKGYTPEEVDDYQASLQPAATEPDLSSIPEFLGATQAVRAGGQLLGRMGAKAINALNPGGNPVQGPPQDLMAQRFPGATQVGEGVAMAALPAPGGLLGQIAAGGLYGALANADTAGGALGGAGGALAGHGLGQMAGRVMGAIKGAAQAAFRPSPRLPSGVMQTLGQASGSKALQQVEASLARNPVSSRAYTKIADQNEQLLADRITTHLGQPGAPLTENTIEAARQSSISKINQAVPDQAVIPLPGPLRGLLAKANKITGEFVDLPTGPSVTGKGFRQARSDLLAMGRSPTATVRQRGRELLDQFDQAAAASGQIDPALYGEGRREYRAWLAVTRGKALSPAGNAGELRANPASLRAGLEKVYGTPAVKGGAKTGQPAVDDLIATTNDMGRAASIVPNSGTPTGLAIPAIIADVATTGGMGTLAAFAAGSSGGSKLASGAVTGAMENPAELARLAGRLGRSTGGTGR